MIPAILAAPLVEGVVGNVIGSVAGLFSPSSPAPTSSAATSFNPYLNHATAATAPQPSAGTASNGTMRVSDWNQMSPADQKTWLSSLTGKHVQATDESGRTISGLVSGMQQLGNALALNVGGHFVTLSQLKQISWSPSVA